MDVCTRIYVRVYVWMYMFVCIICVCVCVQCNCYTDTGRKSKQTQFQPEVVEYCFKKTETLVLYQKGYVCYIITCCFRASVTRSAKVIIIGSPGVGKTSLLLRYMHQCSEL